MRRHLIAFIALFHILISLAACGKPARQSTPAEAYQTYIQATRDEDLSNFKKVASARSLEHLIWLYSDSNEKLPINDAIKLHFKSVSAYFKSSGPGGASASLTETGNQNVEGDRATLDVGDSKAFFVQEGGVWRIEFQLGNETPRRALQTLDEAIKNKEVMFFKAALSRRIVEAIQTRAGGETPAGEMIQDLMDELTRNMESLLTEVRHDGDDDKATFEFPYRDNTDMLLNQPGKCIFVKEADGWKLDGLEHVVESPAPPAIVGGVIGGVPGGVIGGVPGGVPPPPPTQEYPGAPKVIRKSGTGLQSDAISRVNPAYPPLAKAAHVGGSVIVEVTVDETGNVISARALSGHPLLKDAAVQAAKGWKFRPTMLSGVPVKVIGTLTFNFAL